MGESLMWSAIVAVALLAWAPVARDLREEFKALRSESARRVQRAARRDVDTIRFCVGGNRPEVVSRTGASAGRHRAPPCGERPSHATRRDILASDCPGGWSRHAPRAAGMRVVLARRRDGVSADGGPPEVHAYRVPDDEGSPAVWRAPCGDVVKPDEVEIVAASTGNPCPRCLILAALASDAPPVGRTELEGPLAPQPPEVLPADVVIEPAVVPLMYAPSWREQVLHFAEPGAERRPYQGGTVVVGLCGGIGWGPHEHAPNDWPMCAECIQIAGGRT